MRATDYSRKRRHFVLSRAGSAWLPAAILAPDRRDPNAPEGHARGAVYVGKYACPDCGGRHTGTNTVATSSRWITFVCADCLHSFRKAAANVSALSRRLGKVAGAISGALR